MTTLQRGVVCLILIASPAILAAGTPLGTVVCWGYELGYDDAPGTLKVLKIAGEDVTNATAVAAGDGHALALRSDGTVVGWGVNMECLSVGYTSTNSDRASGVVRIDGLVLSNVVAIAAGGNHSLALRRDGTVIGWGSHVVPPALSNITAIATGYNYSMGVKRDGTVLYLGGGDLNGYRAYPGYNDSDYRAAFLGIGDSQSVEGLSNVVAVAVLYGEHADSLALTQDGTVVEMSVQHIVTTVCEVGKALAITGGTQGLMLKKDGTVEDLGSNADVPVGLTNIVAIAGGPRHHLALKRDGTLAMWGGYRVKDLAVPPGLSNVVAVSVGKNFFMAITTNTPVTVANK